MDEEDNNDDGIIIVVIIVTDIIIITVDAVVSFSLFHHHRRHHLSIPTLPYPPPPSTTHPFPSFPPPTHPTRPHLDNSDGKQVVPQRVLPGVVVSPQVGDGQVGPHVPDHHRVPGQHHEVPLVPVADAAPHQKAVVVPPQDAPVAVLAVVGAGRAAEVAALAEPPGQPALLGDVNRHVTVGAGVGGVGRVGQPAHEVVWKEAVVEDVEVDVWAVLGGGVDVAAEREGCGNVSLYLKAEQVN